MYFMPDYLKLNTAAHYTTQSQLDLEHCNNLRYGAKVLSQDSLQIT